MRDFLARAADYTLTPLAGDAAARHPRARPRRSRPSARPLLRRSGTRARPDDRRRAPACSRPSPSTATSASRRSSSPGSPASRPRVAQGPRGPGRARCARRRRATRPIPPLDPAADAAPAVAGAGRGGGDAARRGRAPGAYSTTLLKGVTGSGKTEVYLEAVAEALARGRQALVLLPEIALSVEFLDRVEARFGARPAEWHSGVTQAARRRAWIAVATGDARLVVGARSALFLPFADLGLVVVDEEHDGSYKQEDGALYHARDMAVLRASIERRRGRPRLRDARRSRAGPTPTPASTPGSTCPSASASPSCPRCARSTCASDPPEPGRWISRAAGRGGHRAPRRRRAVAPLPQPPRLCAADHLPRLRPPGRLRRTATRAWSSTASASAWSATSAARRSRSPTACPACKVEGRMTTLGPGVERLAEEAAALWPEARLAILSSDLADGPRALKARIEEIAARRRRPRHRHAARLQGPQLPAPDAGRRHRRRPRPAGRRPPRGGEDLPAHPPGRRPRRPRRAPRPRAGPDPPARAPGAPRHPHRRRRGLLARRGRGAPPGADAALRPARRRDRHRHRRAADLGGRPRARRARRRRCAALGAELWGPAPAPIARIRGRHRVRLLVRAPKGVALQPALRAWVGGGAVPSDGAGDGRRRPAELLLRLSGGASACLRTRAQLVKSLISQDCVSRVNPSLGGRIRAAAGGPGSARRAPRPPTRARGRCPPRRGGRSGRGGGCGLLSGARREMSMTGKPTDDLERRIAQARGDEPADLVLRGGRVFDLVTGSMIAGTSPSAAGGSPGSGPTTRRRRSSTSRGWCWCRGSSTPTSTSRAASSPRTSSTAA